jgi:hypothetical protein
MQTLVASRSKFAWKLYFVLLTLLTDAVMPMLPPTIVSALNAAVGLCGLAGLFGYAWSVKVPGPPAFWRGVAVASLVQMIVSLGVMLDQPVGQRLFRMPLALTLALAFASALTVPSAVAIFRYAALRADPIGGEAWFQKPQT